MSQRECAGFNWPPLPISALEPVSSSPEAVSRAGPMFFVIDDRVWPRVPLARDPSPPLLSESARRGVGQLASGARCASIVGAVFPVLATERATYASPDPPGSVAVGVPHPASTATSFSGRLLRPHFSFVAPFQSLAAGGGHEVEPLPDVRSTDARSRDTCRPEGVADSFQVSLNKVEPAVANRCFNLLTKDDWRTALLDEEMPVGPKVPLVVKSSIAASCAERLARA